MLLLERLELLFCLPVGRQASTFKEDIITQGDKKQKEVRMQGSKLYVGNLSYTATSEQLEELFSNHGEVKQVNIIEGRGFGFIEMSNPSEAEKAKDALDGSDFQGRTLRVNEARPPRDKGGRDSRGGRQKKDYRRY